MVDIAKYRCRCGLQFNWMVSTCPRCGSAVTANTVRRPSFSVIGPGVVSFNGVVIGEVEVVTVTTAKMVEAKPSPWPS